MNSLVDKYRKDLASKGKSDPRSNLEITLQLGGALRAAGKLGDYEATHPDFYKEYRSMLEADSAGTLEGIKNAALNAWDKSIEGYNAIGGIDEQDAQDIADREAKIRDRAQSLPWQDWQTAKGSDAVKVFLRDPIEITSNIFASGLGGSGASLAGGAVGGLAGGKAGAALGGVPGAAIGSAVGAATGAGLGSLASEYGSKYLEVLQEAGANLSDPESILQHVSDEALTEKARNIALRRGIPVAIFDGISAGLGGRFLRSAEAGAVKAGRVLTKGEKAIVGAKEALTQGALGGGGEAAGALAAGEKIDPKAVFEEVVGEVGPGAAEVGMGYVRRSPAAAAPVQVTPPAPPATRVGRPTLSEQQRNAARATVSTFTAPPIPAIRKPSPASLSPELRSEKIKALSSLSAPTADELSELQVLRALDTQSPRNTATAAVASPPPAQVTQVPAAVTQVAPPVTQVAAPAAPAPLDKWAQQNYDIAKGDYDIAKKLNVVDKIKSLAAQGLNTRQIAESLGELRSHPDSPVVLHNLAIVRAVKTMEGIPLTVGASKSTVPSAAPAAPVPALKPLVSDVPPRPAATSLPPATRLQAANNKLKRVVSQIPASLLDTSKVNGILGDIANSGIDDTKLTALESEVGSLETSLPNLLAEKAKLDLAAASAKEQRKAEEAKAKEQKALSRKVEQIERERIRAQVAEFKTAPEKVISDLREEVDAAKAAGANANEAQARLAAFEAKVAKAKPATAPAPTAPSTSSPVDTAPVATAPITSLAGQPTPSGDPIARQVEGTSGAESAPLPRSGVEAVVAPPAVPPSLPALIYKDREDARTKKEGTTLAPSGAALSPKEATISMTRRNSSAAGGWAAAVALPDGRVVVASAANLSNPLGKAGSGIRLFGMADRKGNTRTPNVGGTAPLHIDEAVAAGMKVIGVLRSDEFTKDSSPLVFANEEEFRAASTQADRAGSLKTATAKEDDRRTKEAEAIQDPIAILSKGGKAIYGAIPGKFTVSDSSFSFKAVDSETKAETKVEVPLGNLKPEHILALRTRVAQVKSEATNEAHVKRLDLLDAKLGKIYENKETKVFDQGKALTTDTNGNTIDAVTAGNVPEQSDAVSQDDEAHGSEADGESVGASVGDNEEEYPLTPAQRARIIEIASGIAKERDARTTAILASRSTKAEALAKAFRSRPPTQYDFVTPEMKSEIGRLVQEVGVPLESAQGWVNETLSEEIERIDRVSKRRSRIASPARRSAQSAAFAKVMNRLKRRGYRVDVVAREFQAVAGVSYGPYHLAVSLEDITNPNLSNLVTLIHELGHGEYAKVSGTLFASMNGMLRRAREASERTGVDLASNITQDYEEALAETVAQELVAEGIPNGMGLFKQLWSLIKELYHSTFIAVSKSLGLQVPQSTFEAWFKNHIAGIVGGRFDHQLSNLFSQKPAITSEPQPWETGPKYQLAPAPGIDIEREEAEARIQAATLNELNDAINQVKAESVAESIDMKEFWKIVGGRFDHPTKILDKLESRSRGSSTARIAGERMTDAMNRDAEWRTMRTYRKIERSVADRLSKTIEQRKKAESRILEQAQAVNELEGEFRDASVHEYQFQTGLKDLIKDLGKDTRSIEGIARTSGRLAQAIKYAEGELAGDVIPDEYQKVFKSILDGKTPVFDYMAALSKLPVNFAETTPKAIRDEAIAMSAADPRLEQLKNNRPLFVALTELAQRQAKQMDLLRLRALSNRAELVATMSELEQLRKAGPQTLSEIEANVGELLKSSILKDRLRGQYVKARQALNRSQKVIQAAETKEEILTQAKRVFGERAVKLEPSVGAFSEWAPNEGAKWFSMVRSIDGTWSKEDRVIKFNRDGVIDDEYFHDRILANTEYLSENKAELSGTRFYNEVLHHTQELKRANVTEAMNRTERHMFDYVTQSLQKKFSTLGDFPAARAIVQMLSKHELIGRAEWDGLERKSQAWTAAAKDLVLAAGYKGQTAQFYDDVLTPVIYAIESESGKELGAAMKLAERVARANIKAGVTVAADFDEKLRSLLLEHKKMSEEFVRVAEKNKLYIADASMKDPLTGGDAIQRHALPYGAITATRRVRSEVIALVTDKMQAAGWEFIPTANGGVKTVENFDSGNLDEKIVQLFTPEITSEFLEPFIDKPGYPIFRAPGGEPIPQIELQQIWDKAGGDPQVFFAELADAYPSPDDEAGEPVDSRAHFLQQVDRLFKMTMEITLSSRDFSPDDVFGPNAPRSHRLMDARKNDLLPPEFLRYDVFDKGETRIGLTQVAFHAAFGRSGSNMITALGELKTQMAPSKQAFEAFNGDKAAIETAGLNYNQLKGASESFKDIESWEKEWRGAFGQSQTSQVGEMRLGLETLKFVTGMTINQPTSGLWNIISLFDFPMAFKGLGKASTLATRKSIVAFTRYLFGNLGEAIGLNVLRKGERQELLDTMLGRGAARDDVSKIVGDTGRRGAYDKGGVETGTRIVRGANAIMRKFNLLAPFRVLNQSVAAGIIEGHLSVLETMIGKGAKYFEDHPEAINNPNFKFKAQDLGLLKKGGGMGLFSDDGAFNYWRQRTTEYGFGSLEKVVREAMQRRTEGGKLLTRDQEIAAATMALNDVSLEASANNRPEWTRTPAVQWAMPLLGWPIAKMGAVNNTFRGEDGVVSARSFARGMTLLLAWSLPAGFAMSLLMDEWDEEVKGKKANRRSVPGIAGVPIVGPGIALASSDKPFETFLSMSQVAVRAGTYGIGTELVSQFWQPLDPTAGQKAFSLDNRVFIASAIRQVQQAAASVISGEAFTYANAGRPLLQSLGGNGPLEGVQIMSNLFGFDNAETRMARRTSIRNWLRVAGAEAGLNVKTASGTVNATPLSTWMREMELACFANDHTRFSEAYRNAIEVVRKTNEANPEQKVLNSWKEKNPYSVFTSRILTDSDVARLNKALGPEGREIVNDAMSLYDRYTGFIDISPMRKPMTRATKMPDYRKQFDPKELRRKALAW